MITEYTTPDAYSSSMLGVKTTINDPKNLLTMTRQELQEYLNSKDKKKQ